MSKQRDFAGFRMCACNLGIAEGTGNILVQWQSLLLSLHILSNWIKIIVFRIAGPYIIFRQITNLPQLRTSAVMGNLTCYINPHLTIREVATDEFEYVFIFHCCVTIISQMYLAP